MDKLREKVAELVMDSIWTYPKKLADLAILAVLDRIRDMPGTASMPPRTTEAEQYLYAVIEALKTELRLLVNQTNNPAP